MSKEIEMLKEVLKNLEAKERAEKVELSTLKAGETFKIGEHDFIVLEQKDSNTAVISKNFMAKNMKFDNTTKDYSKSSIKRYIEETIQPIIEDAVGKENLVEHEVELVSVDNQTEFEPCKCKVRLITFDEARKYNNLIVDKELNGWWWTLTPWSTSERGYEYSVAVVSPAGNIDDFGSCSYGFGVRPFCILKSNIFVSKGDK